MTCPSRSNSKASSTLRTFLTLSLAISKRWVLPLYPWSKCASPSPCLWHTGSRSAPATEMTTFPFWTSPPAPSLPRKVLWHPVMINERSQKETEDVTFSYTFTGMCHFIAFPSMQTSVWGVWESHVHIYFTQQGHF